MTAPNTAATGLTRRKNRRHRWGKARPVTPDAKTHITYHLVSEHGMVVLLRIDSTNERR
jgi:hypothetical protein